MALLCVRLARLQRLVCVNESIHQSRALPVRRCLFAERRENAHDSTGGGESVPRGAQNPDSYWEFKSSLSLRCRFLSRLPHCFCLPFAGNSSSFPVFTSSPSPQLHAFSCWLLHPQDISITKPAAPSWQGKTLNSKGKN